MKCFLRPPNDPFLTIRQSLVDACDGNVLDAAMLCVLSIKHDSKMLEAKERYERRGRGGVRREHASDVPAREHIQWHTEKYLAGEVMIYAGAKSIRASLGRLEALGFLQFFPDLDRIEGNKIGRHMLLIPEAVNAAIRNNLGQKAEGRGHTTEGRGQKADNARASSFVVKEEEDFEEKNTSPVGSADVCLSVPQASEDLFADSPEAIPARRPPSPPPARNGHSAAPAPKSPALVKDGAFLTVSDADLAALKGAWKSCGLDSRSDSRSRTTQGYSERSARKQVGDALKTCGGVEAVVRLIEAYGEMKQKTTENFPQFSTFFGPEKRIWKEVWDSLNEAPPSGSATDSDPDPFPFLPSDRIAPAAAPPAPATPKPESLKDLTRRREEVEIDRRITRRSLASDPKWLDAMTEEGVLVPGPTLEQFDAETARLLAGLDDRIRALAPKVTEEPQ